jgi:uncharacterized protein YjiS (DUF1127 family)
VKPIVGHPGYFVDEDGSVFSNKRRGAIRRKKASPDNDGYLHVVLSTGGRLHTIKVQRLVALHFLGPKPDGMVVCHNDGDKLNNSVWNLRYDTQAANIADIKIHGTENPPRGSRNGMSKLTEAQVRKMRELREERGLSHRVLGDLFGISREQARDIVNRKFWRHV